VGDSWAVTDTSSAPARRYGHTAVWTGSEMIVWGGFNGSLFLNSGGRYDPTGNSWVAVTKAGAPSGRRWHTAVWTGDKMVVWGGHDGGCLNTGGRYAP
jgi:hypothetical protein